MNWILIGTQALEFRTPFFLIWSLPRLWYGSLSGSISLSNLSIFYNISCYNSLVLLTFVSRSSCRFTYKNICLSILRFIMYTTAQGYNACLECDIWNCYNIIYVIVNALKFWFLLFSKITQSQHDPAIWLPLQFTEHHLIYNSMPGSVTYIRRS